MLPPVPHTTKSAPHLLWHPKEKKLWMLDLHGGDLWRVEEDGSGEVICKLPAGLELTYQHGSGFYFDGARGTAVFFIITYDRFDLFELKGKKFVEVKQKNTLEPANADVYVFDQKREVLVHFAGTNATDSKRSELRAARGGTTVRELGNDGAWRDVGTPLASATGMYCMGGWDAQLELAVLVDDAADETWGWNGKAWKALAPYPTSAWRPFHAGTTASGSLLIAHKERGSSETAQVFALAKGRWVECDANGLCEWGGIANGFIFGPWFGPGTVQHTLGRFDEKKRTFIAAGKPVPRLDFGSVSGAPRFFGTRSHVRTNAAPVAPLKFSASLDLNGALPLEAIAHHAEARGDLSVLRSGELQLEAKRVAPAPKGFTEREATNFGGDGAGAVLLVGGEVSYGAKRLTDVWHLAAEGKAWTKLTRTGAAPLVVGATVGFHASSATWVLLGGRDKHYRTPNLTWELDDKKWSSFPTKLSDEKKPDQETYARAALLATDSVSGALVFVQSRYGSACVYAYQGKGQWLLVGQFKSGTVSAFAWDQEKRAVLGVSAEANEALPLGAKLDALPKPKRADPAAQKTAVIAREVWLRQRTGDRDRFWFARIDGPGWVERFGERSAGGKTTEKRHAKRATYEAAVRAKLAAGYEPSTDKSERPAGRMSFRPVYGKRGDDLAGGVPAGISAKDWPKCRDCELPLTHVMTLHAHAERLPLEKHAALSIFFCTNEETGGLCETWDEDGTANRVVLVKRLVAPLAKAPGAVMKERRISYAKQFEPDPDVDGENESDVAAVPKVNGYPGWIQGDATPSCGKCKKAMRFVAQLSEFDEALNFAGGDAYAFVCESEHEGAVLWQH
ncbi:MAG: hypothetical protein JNM17_29815 [Archangium sp.]|nr:hypothetical protein [Archangium sp.]